jgi:hypothetical protein
MPSVAIQKVRAGTSEEGEGLFEEARRRAYKLPERVRN